MWITCINSFCLFTKPDARYEVNVWCIPTLGFKKLHIQPHITVVTVCMSSVYVERPQQIILFQSISTVAPLNSTWHLKKANKVTKRPLSQYMIWKQWSIFKINLILNNKQVNLLVFFRKRCKCPRTSTLNKNWWWCLFAKQKRKEMKLNVTNRLPHLKSLQWFFSPLSEVEEWLWNAVITKSPREHT